MKKKYNLALIPQNKGDEVVQFAQQFSTLANQYLLGEHSLPHVTLYQFEAEEDEIEHIWGQVCAAWQEMPINLKFTAFSCITFDNATHWVSLLPDNNEVLHQWHGKIASLIKQPVKKSFDPHMTLIDTKNQDYVSEVHKISGEYKPVSDSFVLTLGASDEVGQFTEILHSYAVKNTLSMGI